MRGCGVLVLAFIFLWVLGAGYYTAKDKPEEPIEYTDSMPKIEDPDSTREIEYFDFGRMEYKYRESYKLERRRYKIKPPIDNYEDQIIIDGKRYRLRHTTHGTELILIR
jgi:hypothetical protein